MTNTKYLILALFLTVIINIIFIGNYLSDKALENKISELEEIVRENSMLQRDLNISNTRLRWLESDLVRTKRKVNALTDYFNVYLEWEEPHYEVREIPETTTTYYDDESGLYYTDFQNSFQLNLTK